MNEQFNPNILIQMIRNGQNPQQLMMQVLQSQLQGTPLGNNLISLAQAGKTNEIEQVIRNLFAARGLDYDKEFAAFRQQFGL